MSDNNIDNATVRDSNTDNAIIGDGNIVILQQVRLVLYMYLCLHVIVENQRSKQN